MREQHRTNQLPFSTLTSSKRSIAQFQTQFSVKLVISGTLYTQEIQN